MRPLFLILLLGLGSVARAEDVTPVQRRASLMSRMSEVQAGTMNRMLLSREIASRLGLDEKQRLALVQEVTPISTFNQLRIAGVEPNGEWQGEGVEKHVEVLTSALKKLEVWAEGQDQALRASLGDAHFETLRQIRCADAVTRKRWDDVMRLIGQDVHLDNDRMKAALLRADKRVVEAVAQVRCEASGRAARLATGKDWSDLLGKPFPLPIDTDGKGIFVRR